MLIELQLAIQEVGIGLMSDRLEESIDRNLCAVLIRFALIHNQLEAAGIISKPDGRGSRELLVTTQEQLERILHPEI